MYVFALLCFGEVNQRLVLARSTVELHILYWTYSGLGLSFSFARKAGRYECKVSM